MKIIIDCQKTIGPLRPIWRSFGYDEINWTYTPRGKRIFNEISKLSPEPYYIRCHNTFTSGNGLSTVSSGSCNVYSENGQGEPVFDFSILDQVIETILLNNCKPVVELGFMPDALSKAPKPKPTYNYDRTNLWVYPPKDYPKWQNLVFQTVKHFVEKYGEKEVETWYWELWNEPDYSGFFKGSVNNYCRLYDYSVAGATSALPAIRIGGPGLAANPAFLVKFLTHCSRGKNVVTGKRGTRLDFISFHAKGNGWPLKGQPFEMPSLATIFSFLEKYNQVLEKFPHYKNIDCLFDECDMAVATNFGMYDFSELEFNNTSYYPVFLVRMVKHLLDFIEQKKMPIKFFTTWAFYFEGKRFFEGNRALFTNENIKKPVFNAFTLLEMLGDKRISFEVQNIPDSTKFPITDGLATQSSPNSFEVVLWNFDEKQENDNEATYQLNFNNLISISKSASIRRYQIDLLHSNSYFVWKEMGSPQDPSPQQLETLRHSQNLEMIEKEDNIQINDGELRYRLTLPECSVCLLQIEVS